MRYYTITALIILSGTCYGQKSFDKSEISDETEEIVSKIEKVNELMGSAVYESGIRPAQYNNFIKLKETASKSELEKLTSHPNGVVRCYSFWALSYDKSTNLLPIVIMHINDEEMVKTQFGCIGGSQKVGDFFVDIVTPEYVDVDAKKLDLTQEKVLDSILIYSQNNLDAKSDAISRASLTENLYSRIRELVVKNHDQAALVTLAKYQREQDVQLILKNRDDSTRRGEGYYFTYKAIREFPHPDFLPFLERNLHEILDDTHYGGEWSALYMAIASFKNEKAVELLNVPFTKVKHIDIRKYHIDFVFGALRQYKLPIYDNLLWTLWANENRIAPDVFKYLCKKDPQRAFELTKKDLLNDDVFSEDNFSFDTDNADVSENLTTIMLDLVLQKDRQFGLNVIRKNIKSTDVYHFPIFSNKAKEIKDNSFIEPLFNRLLKEANPHIYLRAAEALISYKNTEVNKRLLEARNNNTNLKKGWGGKDFNKLLKENNIQAKGI